MKLSNLHETKYHKQHPLIDAIEKDLAKGDVVATHPLRRKDIPHIKQALIDKFGQPQNAVWFHEAQQIWWFLDAGSIALDPHRSHIIVDST